MIFINTIIKKFEVVVIMLVIALLSIIGEFIGSKLSLIDSFERSLVDFDYTDIYYQNYFDSASIKLDDRIVLVNVGHLSRFEIGLMVESINKHEPAVIGMNLLFLYPKEDDSLADVILADALSKVENLEMIGVPRANDSIETSWPSFTNNATIGISQFFSTDNVTQSIKTYTKYFTIKNTRYNNFAINIAATYDSSATSKILNNSVQTEDIFYSGNILDYSGNFGFRYIAIEGLDILQNRSFNSNLIRDKIILFTYLGEFLGDNVNIDDKYYTPLNPNVFGKTERDMFSGVIIANIISSVLDGIRIYKNSFVNSFVTLIFAFLAILLFKFLYLKYQRYYHVISKIIAFMMFNLIIIGALLIFGHFHVKLQIGYMLFTCIFVSDATEFVIGRNKGKANLQESL